MRPALVYDSKGREQSGGSIDIDYGTAQHLVPDAEYEALCLGHDTAMVSRVPKVFLRFRIITMGEHHGKELYRAFRVKALRGRPGRGGSFGVKSSHEVFRMICRVLQLRTRPDQISLRALKGNVFRITTRTVKVDSSQRELPDCLRYSVVDEVLELLEGPAVSSKQ
jgi:hypothetical protein